MFERFTTQARAVVVGARDAARRREHPLITTADLLTSLLSTDAGEVLTTHGVTADAVEAQLAALTSADPRAADDDAVLAAFGIDVARIRATVEAAFGPGALDRPLDDDAPTGLLARLRRRDRTDEVAALRRRAARGGMPFSDASKKALELSLREALRFGDRHIGPEHLALGLLRTGDGAAALVLDRLGADPAALRRDLEGRLRRSA